jgi:transcriptional regulator with XRE-family HTH domain/Zn-dependent peptidase ImmA (M78 family)
MMTNEYWNNDSYQRIKEIKIKGNSILVCFLDNSDVNLKIEQIIPPTHYDDIKWENVDFQPYELSIPYISGSALEIPWTTIRLLSDPVFASYWAGQSEKEAKKIGEKIKILRTNRGLTSKEVAIRAGISPQSLSRIENGHHDVVFTTLGRILAAMGYTLKDLAAEVNPLEPIKNILKKLDLVGLSKEFVMSRLLPPDIAYQMEAGNSNEEVLDQTTTIINRIFGWKKSELSSNLPLSLENNYINSGVKLKSSKVYQPNQTNAYIFFAHYLALNILGATKSIKTNITFPETAAESRKQIFSLYGAINLQTMANYLWDLGIPVLPLFDPGKFHGACWRIGDRNIIILKQNTSSQGRWLFDLAHEFGHILKHLSTQPTIVEINEIAPFEGDVLEKEASDFAFDLLLNNQQERLAEKCVDIAKGKVEYLKSAVLQVAADERVPVDLVANYIAFRLEKSNTVNWWGTANNLQITDPHPGDIIKSIFFEKIDLNLLNPIDKGIVLRSLQS